MKRTYEKPVVVRKTFLQSVTAGTPDLPVIVIPTSFGAADITVED